jgi:hypothetical protein
MKIRSISLVVLVSAAFITSLPLIASAEELILVAPVLMETVNVRTFLNGGVGKDDQSFMHRVAWEFPLRMTFSERKDGEFILDVPVVISDSRGNPVFELPKAGPMLYVMLPNGKYKVSARFKGLTESQEVTISDKTGADLYFHWNGVPKK